MEVLFYVALFLTGVFVIPWLLLYAIPMALAFGAAGWSMVEGFQNLLVPESHKDLRDESATLDKLNVFPYTKARAELRKVILLSKSRNRVRNDRKALAS